MACVAAFSSPGLTAMFFSLPYRMDGLHRCPSLLRPNGGEKVSGDGWLHPR